MWIRAAMWPDRRLIDLFKIEIPIIQAPMGGAMDWELAAAVSSAGGLGSLPCVQLTPDQIREQFKKIRGQTSKPINLNFFCHRPAVPSDAREAVWRERLAPYYREMQIDPAAPIPTRNLPPFDAGPCAIVEDLKPEVVSFHLGLPEPALLDRVKAAGCVVASSATTTAEAKWLEKHGADAVIAQGLEAGGHRGMFLTEEVATQVGTLALVPQIADAVKVPVIAAGGIGDARAIAAAFALGAAGVQIGTAYLFCSESKISTVYRSALVAAQDDSTALTNLLSGRPARAVMNRLMREIGPLSTLPPEFPLSGGALTPLRAKAEAQGSGDFSPMWAGQAASLGRALPAAELTRKLAVDSLDVLHKLSIDGARD
jgi:nitronate monooxygenase